MHGNNTLENTTRNAIAILELAGSMCRSPQGARSRWCSAHGVRRGHGKWGLDGADLPEPRRPIAKHAVDFIIAMADRHRGELVLATIGPETNVAMALRREPRLTDWIREITVMGGSTRSGNVTTAAEFNIDCDPEAAGRVQSGIPIRMVGYNITRRTGFNRADIDNMGRATQGRGRDRRPDGILSRPPTGDVPA